jgi:flagellar protein FlaG
MDLEVQRAATTTTHVVSDQMQRVRQADRANQEQAKDVARKIAQTSADTSAKAERSRTTQQYLAEILDYTEIFNKRLKFAVNEELDQVVVKVIDAQTDKVIKEIPPETLQRLHVRIREAIGLLIDESI